MCDLERESEMIIEELEKATLIHLNGAIETMRSLELEEKLRALIQKPEPKLIFDLSGVTHLSSSGIRVLLTTLREADALGGKLLLCHLSEVVHKMVEAVELDQVFDIFPTVEEALENI